MSSLLVAQSSKLSPYSRGFIDTRNSTKNEMQWSKLRSNFGLKTHSDVSYVSAYIYLNANTRDVSFLETYGVIVDNAFDSILTVKIPINQVEAVAESDFVAYIEIGTPVTKKMAFARVSGHVDKVQAGTELSHPFLGTGVIVGVVDYGFQYNHINFYDVDDDYKTLRVKRVWNQTNGRKYTTKATIEAAQYDDPSDNSGHATHVTGIAAGSYSENTYYGVAKDADIVMVSYGNSNVDVSNGIKYIYDYATEVNKPAVVNMSLGVHLGPHDGTSTFDITCDNMQGAGRLLVGSAGNEGNMDLYRENVCAKNQTVTNYLSFQSYYDQTATVDIWGDNNQKYAVQLVISNSAGTIQYTSPSYNATLTANYSLTASNYGSSYGSGDIYIYTELGRNSTNAKGNVLVYLSDFSLNSGYKLGIKYTATTAGTIRAWGSEYELYWENGTTASTVGEIGGTGKKIISVGAYTSFARYVGSQVNRIANFSSKGPTADGRTKPDIAAPGDAIISSIPNTNNAINNASGKISKTIGSDTYYWAYMSGTSMASPFVTGVLATWLEANPNLTPEKVREILSTSSSTDIYTGICPNNTWGYGKIDAYEGLLKVIETTPIQNLETMPDAILVYPNPNNGSFNLLFTEADNNLQVTIYTSSGQHFFSTRIGTVYTQENRTINLNQAANGFYIVKVKGDHINETFRLVVR